MKRYAAFLLAQSGLVLVVPNEHGLGLPLIPIETEHPTPNDRNKAVLSYARVVFDDDDITKIAETQCVLKEKPSLLILYEVAHLFIENNFMHVGALMLSLRRPPPVGHRYDQTVELLRAANSRYRLAEAEAATAA